MAVQSELIDIVKITPNSNPRNGQRIERITPHCIVGQMKAIDCANLKSFKAGGGASANYIIGKDGEVLLNVTEDRRAWTSGGNKKVNGHTGAQNDYKAITFECASDATAPYAFKEVVYNKLVDMCVDICRRYGRTKLIWFSTPQEAEAYKVGTDEMILTWHRWYANKSCPGDWMYSRGKQLADTVTARLGGVVVTPVPKPTTNKKEDYEMLPLIKKGSKGKAVRIWQEMLGVTVDGVFGPITESNTKKFQKNHGLTQDGIVGPKTWKAGISTL